MPRRCEVARPPGPGGRTRGREAATDGRDFGDEAARRSEARKERAEAGGAASTKEGPGLQALPFLRLQRGARANNMCIAFVWP